MRKILILVVTALISIGAYAASYTVKYKVGNSHRTTTLELKGGTESEAKAELVRRGTVSKKDADKIIILEITAKNKK